MKELTEIKFEEMTVEQKIGFALIGMSSNPMLHHPEEFEYVLDLVRKRMIGAVWVQYGDGILSSNTEVLKMIREAADYPVLVFTDAESGFDGYKIGQAISLGYAGDVKSAYAYGKAMGIRGRELGYDFVCNPVLDRVRGNCVCGGVMRTIHPDKERCAELAAAICRGMHDGGVMNCAKHFPSARGSKNIDSHMAPTFSMMTREELLEDSLYPYIKLNEQRLIDAVMISHKMVLPVDDRYPSSLSKKAIDILRRDVGFDGLALTDALGMMSIVSSFGLKDPKWMCIEAGADLSLAFGLRTKVNYEAMVEGYKSGKLSDKMLDSAVKRVLAYQHRANVMRSMPKATLTEEEETLARSINKNSIAAICDGGLSPTVPRDGHHLFVFLVNQETKLDTPVENDSISDSWYKPELLAKKVKKLFPNSDTAKIREFPSPSEIADILKKRVDYDDVVFVSYFDVLPYVGREAFTPRIISLIEGWQESRSVSALVHIGNPFVMEDLPHIPRIINACKSTDCSEYAIDVLAGDLEPHGKIPYKINLK